MTLSPMARLPMAWFDQTPSGRIVNRFSNDINDIDIALGPAIQNLMEQLLLAGTALGITWTLLPELILPCLCILAVYRRLSQYYRPTNRDIKRLESVARSPIYAHFSETLYGVSTVRAYHEVGVG